MRATVFCVLVCLSASALGAGDESADAGTPASPLSRGHADLASGFLVSTELNPEWRVLNEAAEPIDAQMHRQGLRETSTRHYTRIRGPVSEVCTIELWRFAHPASANGVADSLALPDWQILRADTVLVLTHGVHLERQVGSHSRLLPDCAALGRRTHDRIARSGRLSR